MAGFIVAVGACLHFLSTAKYEATSFYPLPFATEMSRVVQN